MRRFHTPSTANRKRLHPLEAQSRREWVAGLAVMLAAILCAILLSLPSLYRARFDEPNELEREPVENAATPDLWGYESETKEK